MQIRKGCSMAKQAVAGTAVDWTEAGLVPDVVVRHGIRRLLRQRLAEIHADDCELSAAALSGFVDMMEAAGIAPQPARANEQHYEVPAEFFAAVLGAERKYSCCYWTDAAGGLDRAEADALRITAMRAQLADGQAVLDLGCGWGSLSLWIARHYPASRVTAVSNSRSQHDYIVAEAGRRGLGNLTVLTRDMNDFDTDQRYDRIVSVEMFEHMRNYGRLFARIGRWLDDDGLFFLHIFCHRTTPYEFIDRGAGDWMSRHFFAGGMMPSNDLPLHFQQDLQIVDRWRWNGRHYARTSNAWLANMDRNRDRILPILRQTYGTQAAPTWWSRWRIFFMACAEMFDFADGEEWYVGHYLFRRQARQGG